jgi:hypothetical protein
VLREAQGISHTAAYMLVRESLRFRGGTKLPPRTAAAALSRPIKGIAPQVPTLWCQDVGPAVPCVQEDSAGKQGAMQLTIAPTVWALLRRVIL